MSKALGKRILRKRYHGPIVQSPQPTLSRLGLNQSKCAMRDTVAVPIRDMAKVVALRSGEYAGNDSRQSRTNIKVQSGVSAAGRAGTGGDWQCEVPIC